MAASSTQFTFFVCMPTESPSSAPAEKARAAGAEAKDAYRTARAPYLPVPARGAGGQAGREACRNAGIECEYLPSPRQPVAAW